MIRPGLILLLTLCGCATTSVIDGDIGPMAAVERAATVAPAPLPGVFVMPVRAVGRQDGLVYLNSEDDYRDQRNLSVEVHPVAQAQIEQAFGQPLDMLRGHRIRIAGAARRVRIDFTAGGRPTGKYYYQTHVVVIRGDQLRSID